jgi:hypothetical protein
MDVVLDLEHLGRRRETCAADPAADAAGVEVGDHDLTASAGDPAEFPIDGVEVRDMSDHRRHQTRSYVASRHRGRARASPARRQTSEAERARLPARPASISPHGSTPTARAAPVPGKPAPGAAADVEQAQPPRRRRHPLDQLALERVSAFSASYVGAQRR